ncbi:MAG: OB-fold nucleic acid binding domain-containing protein [Flavobacteriales bacterium]|nr:OB-fold nucleic acid binding domain-containing protein [Flavobacteriales bacterium]
MSIKKVMIAAGIIGLFVLNSCGSEFDEKLERAPQAFYNEYVSGYKMKDHGNLDLDGKKVTISGTVGAKVNYTKNDKSGVLLEFIKLGESDFFTKYGITAMFYKENDETLNELKEGDKVKFTGTISSYQSMDKTVELENCELI